MKYSQVIPAYKLTWEEINQYLEKCYAVVLKENSKQIKEAWLQHYFYGQDTENFYFLKYGEKMTLAFSCVKEAKCITIRQIWIEKKYLNDMKTIIANIELSAEILLMDTVQFEKKQIDPAWIYTLLIKEFKQDEMFFQKKINRKKALVLSGGGAKGAYQIGSWQAFVENDLVFPIITGTSVGALNGALILQGDFQQAKKMWEEIDSNQILDFPLATESIPYSSEQVLGDVQSFIKTAVVNKGIKTDPLKQLIQDRLDTKKMKASPSDLYICTTKAKNMTEVVIELKKIADKQINDWLLASSSFFPAMSATKIADDFYIDGGYRNNIPVDVAINHGANNLLIVDIMGPGITKTPKIPANLAVNVLKSHWPLGNVLLFDGSRSKWNIVLGYLEAQKLSGVLSGNWYTFNYKEDEQVIRKLNRRLLRDVLTSEQVKFLTSEQLSFLFKKIRKLTHDKVSLHTFMFDLLEMLAKILNVSPIKVYSDESFTEAIVEAYEQVATNEVPDVTMLLSIGEMLQQYFGSAPLISEESQLLIILDLLQRKKITQDNWKLIFALNPTILLMAQILKTLLKERSEDSGTGV